MKKTILLLFLLFAVVPALSAQERPWMNYINPSGFFQAGYRFDSNYDNTFYIRRARFSIRGELYKSAYFGSLEYRVQAELAGSPKLMDYWIKYSIFDELNIQLGQFKTPLSIENTEYLPLQLEMIDYSLLVQRMVRMSANDVSGISAAGRDMGVQLYGKALKLDGERPWVSYNVGFFNGNGINKIDDDWCKDFYARLMVHPRKDLSLSGYYMRRLIRPAGNPPEFNDYDYFIRDRYGAGVSYDSKYAWFRTEYMAGHTNGWRHEGAYVTAGYKFTERFNMGLRCDYFTTNSREYGNDQWYYTAGASWYPLNRRFRLQLNYMYKQEADRSVTHLVNFMTTIVL